MFWGVFWTQRFLFHLDGFAASTNGKLAGVSAWLRSYRRGKRLMGCLALGGRTQVAFLAHPLLSCFVKWSHGTGQGSDGKSANVNIGPQRVIRHNVALLSAPGLHSRKKQVVPGSPLSFPIPSTDPLSIPYGSLPPHPHPFLRIHCLPPLPFCTHGTRYLDNRR